MSDPDRFPAAAYDLSEAALNELYRDFDADGADPIGKLIRQADELIEFNSKAKADPAANAGAATADKSGGRGEDGDSKPPKTAPERLALVAGAPREPPGDVGGGASSGARHRLRLRLRPVVAIGFALSAAILLLVGLSPDSPIRTRAASVPLPSPVITGFLQVADLAAGHVIKPGETYGVDIPAGAVRIAVLSGQVALVAKNGAAMRPCSNQPFVVDAKNGSPGTANPFVSSCGRAPSFIQAVIPQPPLPAAAPLIPILPPAPKSGGD